MTGAAGTFAAVDRPLLLPLSLSLLGLRARLRLSDFLCFSFLCFFSVFFFLCFFSFFSLDMPVEADLPTDCEHCDGRGAEASGGTTASSTSYKT